VTVISKMLGAQAVRPLIVILALFGDDPLRTSRHDRQ
jgi:hypothetical protein